MKSTLTTARIVLDIEDRLKLLQKKHGAPSNLGFFPYDGNVVGGVLLGIGMAVTGSCPGTSLVQAGTGMIDGMLVVIGGVLGAAAYVKLQPRLRAVRASSMESASFHGNESDSKQNASKRPRDIATAFGVQPVVLLLIWVPMCLAVMRLAFAKDNTAREVPQSGLVPPTYGGLFIGAAQLVTTLLTGHAIGASAAYQDIARWIDGKLFPSSSENRQKPALLTPSIFFSGGVICAAAAFSHLIPKSGNSGYGNLWQIEAKSAAKLIVGGMVMVFGARTAGGCTSGHAISGLAKFSLTSLVTTIALFSGGILTARIWPS